MDTYIGYSARSFVRTIAGCLLEPYQMAALFAPFALAQLDRRFEEMAPYLDVEPCAAIAAVLVLGNKGKSQDSEALLATT